ncbi:hypothetical protein [Clostridium cochlearium]|uniref:Uncharacterized protein n=1 Tax=Clostridium cochlearium TaxID=1494 RepID=A0A240AZG9_CLOCO|nr:hypothetical protein [Clostridium cochlearium]NSJ90401.1 hypothetical protein [Coprococcus sp. MSK.21.13]MBE6065169.1 hypothetical protein [Clostridium cochlearium]MDU1442597.1 hypothetical protein [Clostridium cochlearium]NMA57248.1 hypothetical protein [Clostridium cochlearium]NME95809.1 hypothetical protein [Clostridium cochlearium]
MLKNKINELAREVRKEGLFSDAFEMVSKKRVYKFKDIKERIKIMIYFIIAFIIIAFINSF